LPAAAATAAAAATSQGLASSGALASSLDQQGFTLHQPYSHFLWCGYQLNRKCLIRIACALCTDIEELQNVNGICSAQVSVVKHPADFDVKGYVLQHPTMQQEQPVTQGAMLQAGSSNGSSSTVLGPLAATLKRSEDGRVCMSGLSCQIIVSLAGGTVPHTLVLQERVRLCSCRVMLHDITAGTPAPCVCASDMVFALALHIPPRNMVLSSTPDGAP
jgi:hypothetical protein